MELSDNHNCKININTHLLHGLSSVFYRGQANDDISLQDHEGHRHHCVSMLDVGPPGLQCLEYQWEHSDLESVSIAFQKMSTFQGLTKLDLRNFNFSRQSSTLQKLPLQELVIVDCKMQLEMHLLGLGKIRTLRRLHVEEPNDIWLPCCYPTWMLSGIGEALLKLPDLTQLSGTCLLFDSSLIKELSGWQVSASQPGLMTTNSLPMYADGRNLEMWKRP